VPAVMNRSLSLVSVVVAALLAMGCAGSASTPTAPSSPSGSPTSPVDPPPLSGSPAPTVDQLAGTWNLQSLQPAGDVDQTTPAGATYTLTFADGRPVGRHMESPVTSAGRRCRPDHAGGRDLHADLRRRSSVDARGLQRVRRPIHSVRTDADSGTHTGVHAGGLPHHGVRVHLHESARWR